MSWNRTVTCSYCYKPGHNKAGCVKLKDYIAANPDSYRARLAANKKTRKRKCSYCEQTGHNRKTCAQLRENCEIAGKRNKEFRAALLEHFKTLGIGIGTLACWGRHDFALERDRGMVNQIQWERLNVWTVANRGYYGLRSIGVVTFPRMASHGFQSRPSNWLAVPVSDNFFGEPNLCCEYGKGIVDNSEWILSALTPEDVEKGVPSGWLEGDDSALGEHFNKDSNHLSHTWVQR